MLNLKVVPLEEPPFFASEQMGSYIHAQSLAKENIPVKAVIVLEMIGYFSNEPDSQRYPDDRMKLIYPSTGNFIAVVGNFKSALLTMKIKRLMKRHIKTRALIAPPALIPAVDLSDHRNYWELGYNAVMITDTADYRNPYYHTIDDTYDTLSFENMKKVVEAVAWSILQH